MRDYLNAILAFIGVESLTDEEFDAIELEDTDNLVDNYNALLGLLESREAISESRTRLQYYFLAKGADVGSDSPSGSSNIFVGNCL